ncbi:MAG: FadR family transcriptional regulator [Actinobacteria bacterium]|nr:FadR family transcriptional regulator [Actinomycetota bacterium]
MTDSDSNAVDIDHLFKPIVRLPASEEVIEQISHAVHCGAYPVGSRLPTIEDLARAMNVSAPTVAVAVRILSREGVLNVKRGASGGVVVASSFIPPPILRLAAKQIARSLTECVEVRRPIEMAIARLASVRATAEDTEQMSRAIELQRGAYHNWQLWAFADYRFHYVMGLSTRNPLLIDFQSTLIKETAVMLRDWTSRDRSDPEITVVEHERILAAIQLRDPPEALAAMHAHLTELEEFVGLGFDDCGDATQVTLSQLPCDALSDVRRPESTEDASQS